MHYIQALEHSSTGRRLNSRVLHSLHAALLLLPLSSSRILAKDDDEASAVADAAEASGEAVGGVISEIPSTVGSFFAGVGEGAGVHGFLDWAALLIGFSLLISVIQGVRRGRIVGPAIRGVIGIALMGWAVS